MVLHMGIERAGKRLRVLFVCTGNSCRSPIAEALLRARMPASWRKKVEISSSGTGATDGMKAADNAVKVLKEIGIDLSHHRSRRLTKRMIALSDLVVAMEKKHEDEILKLDPSARKKVIVMGSLDPNRVGPDVADPIGGDEEVYRRTRAEIEALTSLLIEFLESKFGVSG